MLRIRVHNTIMIRQPIHLIDGECISDQAIETALTNINDDVYHDSLMLGMRYSLNSTPYDNCPAITCLGGYCEKGKCRCLNAAGYRLFAIRHSFNCEMPMAIVTLVRMKA